MALTAAETAAKAASGDDSCSSNIFNSLIKDSMLEHLLSESVPLAKNASKAVLVSCFKKEAANWNAASKLDAAFTIDDIHAQQAIIHEIYPSSYAIIPPPNQPSELVNTSVTDGSNNIFEEAFKVLDDSKWVTAGIEDHVHKAIRDCGIPNSAEMLSENLLPVSPVVMTPVPPAPLIAAKPPVPVSLPLVSPIPPSPPRLNVWRGFRLR